MKKTRYIPALLAALAVVLIAMIAAYSYFLPESIAIKQGGEETLHFLLPYRASLSGDTEALNINNAPVAQNINIDPRGTVVHGNSRGSACLVLSLFGLPLKSVQLNVLPDGEYVPSGRAVGIVMETDGVLVLGTGSVRTAAGTKTEPCRGLLRSGDLIKSVNGVDIKTKEDLITAVRSRPSLCTLTVDRCGTVNIVPAVSEDGIPMLGLWVRDSTRGIGTLTFYNKRDARFGALGHPVTDVDTGSIMQISGGRIYTAGIDGIVRSEKGKAGELTGSGTDRVIGTVSQNCEAGIYGRLNADGEKYLGGRPCPIALKKDVKCGPAKILSDIDGKGAKEYDIVIESVNSLSKNTSKGMVIRVTDAELIRRTGGIVQGMSGSPIIQNGCLAGAVTHVFVQDPKRGYGIFAENMVA